MKGSTNAVAVCYTYFLKTSFLALAAKHIVPEGFIVRTV